MKKQLLNKPNQLIGLKTNEVITATQRKIYNVFLKIAQKEAKFGSFKNEKINKDDTYWFEVDYKNAHKVAGANNKNLRYIEEQLDDLMGIIVTIREEENPENWKEKFSLLPNIKKEDGKYKFMLIGNIVKALKEQNYFTHLDLIRMQNLQSQYSVIFYELAIRYKKVKIPKMKIEKIREITNTQNEYKRFYDLKKRVLDKACKEISEKTDIILNYETQKKGRKIAYIKFDLERKPEDDLLKTEINNSMDYDKKVLELFDLFPEEEQIESNKETLAKLAEKYEYKYIKADIKYAKKYADKNFMGFLVESCKNGHFGKSMLEKEEKKKELAKKKRKEELKKKKAKKERQKAIEEIVATKCENLAEEEKEKLKQRYNYLIETDSSEIAFEDRTDMMFAKNHSFEEFVKKHLKSKI